MIFVKKPNLPENASIVLVGEKYYHSLSASLNNFGIRVFAIPENPYVDPRIASHADISVLHIRDNFLALSPHLKGTELESVLSRMGFDLIFSESVFDAKYPHDCPLNLYVSDEFAVINSKTADKAVLKKLEEVNIKLIDCRQGYSKCMICPVDSNSIISSDPSIVCACKEQGIDVLEISQGYVDLLGYDYGFLGGSCFKLSEKQIAFTGKLDSHPDKDLILEFLEKHGIQVVFLTDNDVFDVGSIIPIAEKPR